MSQKEHPSLYVYLRLYLYPYNIYIYIYIYINIYPLYKEPFKGNLGFPRIPKESRLQFLYTGDLSSQATQPAGPSGLPLLGCSGNPRFLLKGSI